MYTLTHSYIKGITYFALTHFMYVLRMALIMNGDYLPKQHKMVDLCSRDGLCSLWGESGNFVYYLHVFQVRAVIVHVTYLHTPRSTVLLEKLTVPQLVKKFPAFYVTRRYITAFTIARHLSLSWASSMHCNSSELIHLNNLRMWTQRNKCIYYLGGSSPLCLELYWIRLYVRRAQQIYSN